MNEFEPVHTEHHVIDQKETMEHGLFGLMATGTIYTITEKASGQVVGFEHELFDAINKAIEFEAQDD